VGALTSNPRLRWLLLYLGWLFAFLPVAPWVWRRWLRPVLGAYITLDAIHIGEYVLLGWLLRWTRLRWLEQPSTHRRGAAWLRLICVVGLIAFLDEIVQGMLPNRYADVRDFLCDWGGALVGAVGERCWRWKKT